MIIYFSKEENHRFIQLVELAIVGDMGTFFGGHHVEIK